MFSGVQVTCLGCIPKLFCTLFGLFVMYASISCGGEWSFQLCFHDSRESFSTNFAALVITHVRTLLINSFAFANSSF